MDANEKAADQRQAARDAIEMLEERMGDEMPRLLDLIDRASFRFRPALAERVSCTGPAFAGSHHAPDISATRDRDG